MAESTQFWNHYILQMLLKGVTPFLQNNPAGMQAKKKKGMEPGKPEYDPVIAAEAATYRREDGGLGFPACALRKCLITAGTGIYVTKKKTLASALPEWLGHFPPFEGDELFPFEDEAGQPIIHYEVDIRRAIRGREGVPVARPKIWPWRLRCALKLTLPSTANVEDLQPGLLQVANKAGQYPGLGDGRPERIKNKGMGLWFGKFEVIEFSIEPLSD